MIQESEPEVHGGLSFTPGPMASSSKDKKSKEPNTSSLEPKTEAIYAFRTITTMLSLIHSTRIDTTRNQSNVASHEKQRLQVLDALAAVLIRNNGVVAVTARGGSHDNLDDSGKVEVLASFLGNAGNSLTHFISQPALPFGFLRNIFISQNPRNSSVKQGSGVVVDPETSESVVSLKRISKPTELLNTFLTDIW
jgi:hypothetical protein